MATCDVTLSPTAGSMHLLSGTDSPRPASKHRSTPKSKKRTKLRKKYWTQEEQDALMTFVQSVDPGERYIWGECSDYMKSLNIYKTALSCNRRYTLLTKKREENVDVTVDAGSVTKTRSIEVQTEFSFPPSEEVTMAPKVCAKSNSKSNSNFLCPSTTLVKLHGFLTEKAPIGGRQLAATPLFSILPVSSKPVTEPEPTPKMPNQQPEPLSCSEAPSMEDEDEPFTEDYSNPMMDHTYGKDQTPGSVLGDVTMDPEEADLAWKLKRARGEGPIYENRIFRGRRVSAPVTNPSPTDTVQPSQDDSPSLSNLKHNLRVCAPYINLEYNMLNALLTAGLKLPTLVDLEEGFLELCTYPECCEGTFYLSVYQIEGQIYMRYIESGIYRGSFASVRELIAPSLPSGTEDVVWSQVYNDEDLDHQLDLKTKKDRMRLRHDVIYRRHLFKNKGCIKNCVTTLLSNLKRKEDECGLLGMIIHTKYSRQHPPEEDIRNRWYLHCSGSFQPCKPQLQGFFQQYPAYSQSYEKLDLSFLLQNRLSEAVSLQDQCDAISLIPNYPKSKPNSFKFGHKLPVSDRCPISSRGKIIWARCIAKRSKFLQETCVEMCSEATESMVEDVVMNEQPHQMDHNQPELIVEADESPSPQQSSTELTPDTMPSALQHEDQLAAANLGTTIVYIEYTE